MTRNGVVKRNAQYRKICCDLKTVTGTKFRDIPSFFAVIDLDSIYFISHNSINSWLFLAKNLIAASRLTEKSVSKFSQNFLYACQNQHLYSFIFYLVFLSLWDFCFWQKNIFDIINLRTNFEFFSTMIMVLFRNQHSL